MSLLNQLPPIYKDRVGNIQDQTLQDDIADIILEQAREINDLKIMLTWIRFGNLIEVGLRKEGLCRTLREGAPEEISETLSEFGLTPQSLKDLFLAMPTLPEVDGTEGIWVNREPEQS